MVTTLYAYNILERKENQHTINQLFYMSLSLHIPLRRDLMQSCLLKLNESASLKALLCKKELRNDKCNNLVYDYLAKISECK